ncbi:hypothetical protein DPMN_003094 [Dreissena polymorpha]|uniref:Uncharacterized protein n=1 Tax=Dreissena polymorpha TaxID=45954 RepID=A0A9D4MPZ2_DREPO|nr:hypothetical protein DPMN_003094 [Dreissena polymorpha]
MLTQKGSNGFAVNSEHDTSMLTQKGSNDYAVNTQSTIYPCWHRKAVMTDKSLELKRSDPTGRAGVA